MDSHKDSVSEDGAKSSQRGQNDSDAPGNAVAVLPCWSFPMGAMTQSGVVSRTVRFTGVLTGVGLIALLSTPRPAIAALTDEAGPRFTQLSAPGPIPVMSESLTTRLEQ